MPLAADLPIGQIVFLVLALGAWVLKELAERKQRERAMRRRELHLEGLGAQPGEPDLEEDAPVVPPPLRGEIGQLAERQLETRIRPDMTGHVAQRHARRAQVRRRLGIDARAPRAAVRRAVLWSEILGPPRALSGPHRSPAARRGRSH